MKKSIKFKMFLVFVMMFLFFVATLLISFSVFYRYDFRYSIAKEQDKYENLALTLAKKAQNYNTKEDIENFISTYANENLQIQLKDLNGNTLWSSKNTPQMISIYENGYIVSEGKVKYVLQVKGVLISRFDLLREYMGKYLWIILTCGFGAFFLMGAFLHSSITKPLLALYRRMESNPLKGNLYEKKYRNDEIGELEKKFDDMIIRLKDADKNQQNMLLAISHDLKTPLTSIITYTERLSMGKVKEKDKEAHYYEVIINKANDIRKLIDKFTEAATIGEVNNKEEYRVFKAKKFFEEIFKPYTEEWDDVEATVKYVSTIEEYCNIYVDASALKRVISNVMNNAVKYGERPLIVSVNLFNTEDKVNIEIENNGIEVSIDKMQVIFERFYRIEQSRSKDKGGSGLGLFISREIMEKHSGTIMAYKPKSNDFGIHIEIPIY